MIQIKFLHIAQRALFFVPAYLRASHLISFYRVPLAQATTTQILPDNLQQAQLFKERMKIGLRSKATRTASVAAKIASHKRELAAQPEYHENTLLKLLKTTKKQKQEIKTKAFNERLLTQTLKLKGSVAKSERKRRAKERKEQLKPEIKDLLSSLPQETINLVTTAPRSRDNYIETSKPERPNINPFKITGRLKLIHMERARFTQVLNNEQFRKSPFAALKLAIGQNLDSSA